MIQIDNLTYGYSAREPLFTDFSSMPAPGGGVCGLLGENGAGKSTLLHLMAGLLLPTKGAVRLNGVDVAERRPSTLSDLFLVPEEFSLPPIRLNTWLSRMGGFYPRFSADDFRRYLSLFEMEDNYRLDRLSMGQKKKIYIAFALAAHTSLLLMDEPTNGLDIKSKSQFRKLMSAAGGDEPRTWIISTHQVRDIERLVDSVAILAGGCMVLNEPVSRVMDKLYFSEVEGSDEPEGTLARQPIFGGTRVMLPNEEGLDSDLSLELLYEGTLAHPAEVAALFNPANE